MSDELARRVARTARTSAAGRAIVEKPPSASQDATSSSMRASDASINRSLSTGVSSAMSLQQLLLPVLVPSEPAQRRLVFQFTSVSRAASREEADVAAAVAAPLLPLLLRRR